MNQYESIPTIIFQTSRIENRSLTTIIQINKEKNNNGKLQSRKPKIKYVKIEIFQNNPKAMIGISPKLVIQSYPLNGKILMGFLILSSFCISICMHIFNYAETFSEYTQSIFCVTCEGRIIFFPLNSDT